MLTIDKLKEYGADVETGLARCVNNEALYLRLVNMCIKELSENELKAALDTGNLDKAFEVAHKLKGGVTNLALEPVASPVCELTELLRNKTPGDYDGLYCEIENQTAKLTELAE